MKIHRMPPTKRLASGESKQGPMIGPAASSPMTEGMPIFAECPRRGGETVLYELPT